MALSAGAAHALASILEHDTGQQLTEARLWRLETSLQPVMRAHGVASLEILAAQLTRLGGPATQPLRAAVVEALLNHETSFFRDRATFLMLRDRLLPALAERKGGERRLRIWSAGCATGQEPHSIAMMLAEASAMWSGWSIELVGTDVSAAAIATARAACYSQFEVQRGLAIGELLRHFLPEGEMWRLKPEIAARTQFLTHSLLTPPPLAPGSFDLVLCRNVLLYFSEARRVEMFGHIARALVPDGALVLGAGETVLGQTDAFLPDPAVRSCYRLAQRAGAGAAKGVMPYAA